MNGGEGDFANISVMEGESLAVPATLPSREEYTFNGWEDAETYEVYQAGETILSITGFMLLKAWWLSEETYPLQYSSSDAEYYHEGEWVILRDINETTSSTDWVGTSGYGTDAFRVECLAGERVKMWPRSMSMQYSPMLHQAYGGSLHFHLNGGIRPSDFVDIAKEMFFDTPAVIPSWQPKKPGYHFYGWNTREDGSGVAYQPGEIISLPVTADHEKRHTLYAQWFFYEDAIKIAFSGLAPYYISPMVVPRSILMKAPYAICDNDPNAYTVSYDTSDGTYVSGQELMPELLIGCSLTLVGAYVAPGTAPNQSPPSLDTRGVPQSGNAITVTYASTDEAATGLPEPVTTGRGWPFYPSHIVPSHPSMLFRHWSLDEAGLQPVGIGETLHLESDTTLYAIFEEMQSKFVMLTYDFKGADNLNGLPISEYVEATSGPQRPGEPAPGIYLPGTIPLRSGYVFSGWRSAGNDRVFAAGSVFNPGGRQSSLGSYLKETRLDAIWEADY